MVVKVLQIALASVERPRRTVAVAALVTLLALPGLARLELRTDGHALVPPSAPAILLDGEVREHFQIFDPIVILVETTHPEGIYNTDTLSVVDRVTEAVLELEDVEDVMSLATEGRDRVKSFDYSPFIYPIPETPEEMAALKADIAAAAILEGTLVAKDARAASVLVGVPSGTAVYQEGFDRPALYRRILEAVRPYQTPTERISVVGAPVAEALLGIHILEDLAFLLPLALLTIAAVLFWGCRRLWGVFLGLAEVAACLGFTFGLMGWLGVPVYLTTAILPVVLTTIGLADEVHLFFHYQRNLAVSGDSPHPEAVRATLRDLVRPIVLTSITTSFGFLSFLISDIEPVRTFGIFAAVGVLFCMVLSLTVIPASLTLLSPEKMRPRAATSERGLSGKRLKAWTAPFLRRRRVTLYASALLTLVAFWGAGRLVVQDSWIDGFAEKSDFRRATERVNQALLGTHQLVAHLTFDPPPEQIPVSWNRRGPLLESDALEAIGNFESFARTLPGVGGVLGTYAHLTSVAYLQSGRKPHGRTIPSDPDRIGQVLRHFELGRGEDRRRQVIDDELHRTLVTIYLKNANFRQTAEIMRALEEYVEKHLRPRHARLDFAGDVAVSQAMIPAIVKTQVGSLSLALAFSLGALSLLLRSLITALQALLPTAAAMLVLFGLMGWLEIPLGVATSMFCAITLGIGVDFAIHFLERVRRATDAGHTTSAVVAIEEAGPAIVIDSLAIALGFGLLAASQVPANARLGLLVAAALSVSSILTLIILGALVTRSSDVAPSTFSEVRLGVRGRLDSADEGNEEHPG